MPSSPAVVLFASALLESGAAVVDHLRCGVLALAVMTAAVTAVEPSAGHAEIVHALCLAAEEGRYDGEAVRQLAQSGLLGSLAALTVLDAEHPRRRTMVHDALAWAGRCRGWHPEMLRRYDPGAHAVFHGEGRQEQERVATCLDWAEWPQATPAVLVRAAPLPTLAWLEDQKGRAQPELGRLRLVLDEWASWIRIGRERQYVDELCQRIAALARSPAIVADEPTFIRVLRSAGDAGAVAATEPLIEALDHASAAVRAEALAALAKLPGQRAMAAVIGRSALESDPEVVTRLAERLAVWADSSEAGAAALSLLESDDPRVRHAAVAAAVSAGWPQRAEIITRAMADTDGAVVGAALQAIALDAEGIPADPVLDLAADYAQALPELVDALGALRDPRASLLLVSWLRKEVNGAVQVKLVLALRSIGDVIARKAIASLLDTSTDPVVVEHALAAIDDLAIEDAVPRLLALGDDRTAPDGVRLHAIRALGRFGRPDTQAALLRLQAHALESFVAEGDTPGFAEQDLLDAVAIEIAIARLRHGDAEAGAELQRLWTGGIAASRFFMLQALAETGVEHPVIRHGLASADFAVLLAALRCVRVIGPERYREDLLRLQGMPLLQSIDASIDSDRLVTILAAALEASVATPSGDQP